MSEDFTKKNVVITGASRGLGLATATAFVRSGANVALMARDENQLKEQARGFPKERLLGAYPVDLAQSAQIQTVSEHLNEEISHLDVLINNASGWYVGELESMPDSEIEHLISTSITGSLLMTKRLLPLLKKSENPHIINIISTAGLHAPNIDPSFSSVSYFAAKWGQAGFSEALRGEVVKHGIRVTTLYPGSFSNRSTIDDHPEEVLKNYKENIMVVKDVVDAILFCASRPKHVNIHSLVITP